MRKGPEFRIVGEISEEKKEEEKERLRECLFGERHLEDLPEESKEELRKLEYLKTPEESILIDFANQKTNELMRKAGVKPFNVPERNIHLVPPDLYRKIDSEGEFTATTISKEQAIIANVDKLRENFLIFGSTIFHELLHLKHHLSLEVEEREDEEGKKELKRTHFRSGLRVTSAQKKVLHGEYHEHLRGLNEAIAGLLEKNFIQELLKHPLLKKEREWLESKDAQELKKQIAKEQGIPEEYICAVKPDKSYLLYAYPHQQRVLKYIVDQIQQDFSGEYKNREEVLQEFTRAPFTGRLLPIAKLIEKTFGEGSFRVLGMMKDDRESPVEVLEALKKMRLSHLKSVKDKKAR